MRTVFRGTAPGDAAEGDGAVRLPAGHQGRPAVRGLPTVVGTRPRRTGLLQLGCRTDSPHRQGTG